MTVTEPPPTLNRGTERRTRHAQRAASAASVIVARHLARHSHPDVDLGAAVRALVAELAPWLSPAMAAESTELSERELQVLIGMAQGDSNTRIARKLLLVEDTVKTHARRLFAKLGAKDRANAVSIGYERGILTVGSQR